MLRHRHLRLRARGTHPPLASREIGQRSPLPFREGFVAMVHLFRLGPGGVFREGFAAVVHLFRLGHCFLCCFCKKSVARF